ncbi:MAG: dGTPase, partial [Polaribacter sp.]|nr:dGTPase [Polaribacter sp.]
LIEEEFALEYLIKLVKDTIDIKKYHSLQHKKDRVSYLRALAIGVLINDAVDIFLANEDKILAGNFERSLLDKCKYEAQINDIIKLSISKIYQSKEVVEKEVAGYRIIGDMLDIFITALNNDYNGIASNYDSLILKMLPEEYKSNIATVYQRIMSICSYISGMSDSFAIRIHKKLTGNSI